MFLPEQPLISNRLQSKKVVTVGSIVEFQGELQLAKKPIFFKKRGW